ncbi:MAG: hypothetical protein O2887_18515 [Bacteroidetes bacterium]|nr:hypothetical protein [Bacteroidota bacterium]MDA1122449.1 hypothetical protein [Bacteroidota bacterium]
MNNRRLKIGHIPTDKLVVMVDVSRREYNKQLLSLRNLQKSGSTELGDQEKAVQLWRKRYSVSFTELTRRVNDQFKSMDPN